MGHQLKMQGDRISIRQLSKHTSEVVAMVEESGTPVVIMRHGAPVAELRRVGGEDAAAEDPGPSGPGSSFLAPRDSGGRGGQRSPV